MKHTTNAIPTWLLAIALIATLFCVNKLRNDVDKIEERLVIVEETVNIIRDDIKDISIFLDEYQSNQASATLKTK